MGIDRNRFSRKKEEDVWVDWLSDAPPPAQAVPPKQPQPSQHVAGGRGERLRHAGRSQSPATQQNTQQASDAPAVSIQISIPKFHAPKFRVPWRQVRYYGVLTVGCVVLAIGARASLGLLDKNDKPSVQGASTETAPTYKPAVPEEKKEVITADPSKSAYDAQRKLYAYKDQFMGAQLTVSQQPLPEAFKKNPADVVKAADSINAKEKFETAFGPAYKGYDEKAATERVVFVYRDLLMFVQSNKKFDSDTWKIYIEGLRQ
jgi:hypothetical protein